MSEEAAESDPKAELEAMGKVLEAVQDLPAEGVSRVLGWVAGSLGVAAPEPRSGGASEKGERGAKPGAGSGATPPPGDDAMGCEDAASFVDASGASTGPARAMAVAYWIQFVDKNESWASAEVNKELKHQGHGLANVTSTLNELMKRKPALVVQLKKSGTSKQARKLYKLTSAGKKAVAKMFADSSDGD